MMVRNIDYNIKLVKKHNNPNHTFLITITKHKIIFWFQQLFIIHTQYICFILTEHFKLPHNYHSYLSTILNIYSYILNKWNELICGMPMTSHFNHHHIIHKMFIQIHVIVLFEIRINIYIYMWWILFNALTLI